MFVHQIKVMWKEKTGNDIIERTPADPRNCQLLHPIRTLSVLNIILN